jgi:hypothetical protein
MILAQRPVAGFPNYTGTNLNVEGLHSCAEDAIFCRYSGWLSLPSVMNHMLTQGW